MSIPSIVLTVVLTAVVLLIISAVMRGKAEKVKEIDGEPVIIGDAASLCKGRAAMYGGYLFLTKDRLVFKPSKLGGFGKKADILLRSIVEVHSKRSLVGETNILHIISSTAEHSFMVNNLDTWLIKINELRERNSKKPQGEPKK